MRNLLLLLILLWSCKSNNKTQENSASIEKESISEEEVSDQGSEPVQKIVRDSVNENILDFKVSSCLEDCYDDTGKVITNDWKNDTLSLKLGHFFNCAHGVFFKDFEIQKNTINLITGKEKIVYVDNEGNQFEVEESAACNCYFEVDLKIAGIKKSISKVLINNKKVENTF